MPHGDSQTYAARCGNGSLQDERVHHNMDTPAASLVFQFKGPVKGRGGVVARRCRIERDALAISA